MVREKYTTHVNWMKCLSGGEAALAAAVPAGRFSILISRKTFNDS